MTQLPSQEPVVQVKPQANIYTLLLIVAVLALAVTIGIVIWSLLSPPPEGYGLTFESLFKPFEQPTGQ
ncbi:MAG: hypothetical protein SVT52_04415 [Planctomycetota bacterium]|nr:hypothetical protein [Planctomycetota bacterium]